MIHDQPETGRHEIHHFENEGRISITVDLQGPGRTHGPHKEGVEMVGGINIKKKGDELESKDIGENGGNKIGSSFEDQLEIAPAGDIPISLNADAVTGGVKNHKTHEKRSRVKGDDGGVKNHSSCPSIFPSRH